MAIVEVGETEGAGSSLGEHKPSDTGPAFLSEDATSSGEARKAGLNVFLLFLLCLVSVCTACAGPQPVLRSNTQLQLYGPEAAETDIEVCEREATKSGLTPGVHRSGNVAAGAALGLIGGAAVGASSGVVGGGVGVAIGAAVGGGVGLIIGSLGGAYKPLVPEPPYGDAVVKCLIEKGYEPAGWQ